MYLKSREEKNNDLCEILTRIDNVEDCKVFLADLCTNKEIDKMADRIYAARLLIEGKTYAEVIKDTDISSATLSRISTCVQYGSGYSKILKQ